MAKKKQKKKQGQKPRPAFKSPLLVPLTPFERRMAEMSARIPLPHTHPDAEEQRTRVISQVEFDLAFRRKCWDIVRKLPHWGFMRVLGGSGLLMANTFRDYFSEYCSRLMNHGFHSMPTSFNVVESFLQFDSELFVYDMRPEREHLLAADDFFEWYKSNSILKDPELLMTVMEEGTVYAYNMSGDTTGARLSGSQSVLVIAGISLVRHQDELSCILVAGEQPPNPPDEAIFGKEPATPVPSKEKLVPYPNLGINDRYLDQLPGFARVILLARFDLRGKKYYVRSVNLDEGNNFTILTDDVEAVREGMEEDGLSAETFSKWKATTEEALPRYDVLFSSLASLIFLPLAFVDEIKHVQKVEFRTECFAMQSDNRVKEAIKELGKGCCVNSVPVRCLARRAGPGLADATEIRPPDMTFESKGFWKNLLPGEIGQDKDGAPIVGRTWVTRTENWSASKPQAFLLTRPAPMVTGPDPGIVYIMRSDAHALEIYKIGLTRRTSEKRSQELSSATGVPLPFGVLAQWDVGDCAGVEAEIHKRLACYRINDRREFFRLPLRTIVAVITDVVESMSKPH